MLPGLGRLAGGVEGRGLTRLAYNDGDGTGHCLVCGWRRRCRSRRELEKSVFEHLSRVHDRFLLTVRERPVDPDLTVVADLDDLPPGREALATLPRYEWCGRRCGREVS